MPACSGIGVKVESRHHLAGKRADFGAVLLHENGCNASTENCVAERLTTHARSRPAPRWQDIDWSQCHRRVRSLQTCIVKAWQGRQTAQGESLATNAGPLAEREALSVQRVTENQGKRTAGVAGQTWPTPEAKSKGVLLLKRRVIGDVL